MIIRRTIKTVQKEIYMGKDHKYKSKVLFTKVTFWFLFIPVYSYTVFA